MEAQLSHWQTEERSCVAPHFEHFQSLIHQHGGRAVFRQQDTVDRPSHVYAAEFGNRPLRYHFPGFGVAARHADASVILVWSSRYLSFFVDSVIIVDEREHVVE